MKDNLKIPYGVSDGEIKSMRHEALEQLAKYRADKSVPSFGGILKGTELLRCEHVAKEALS